MCLLWVLFCLSPAVQAQRDNRGVKPIQIKAEDGKEMPLYSASHALVIGVSAYTKGWKPLPGVAEDIAAVQTVLAQHGFQVTVVNNPTGAELELAIKNFVGTHGQAAKNRLLFYFAGHGHTLRTTDQRTLGYLVPSDAPLPERGIGAFKQAALSLDTIEVYAKQIESLHALFVFDSCFSGTLFEAMRSTPSTILDKVTKPVRMFITAGTADQQVPDKSIFREEFVRGINGAADYNQDGYVTGSELGVYVEDKVTNYSHKAQTPRWGKIRHPDLDKGDFVFMTGKADKPNEKMAPPTVATRMYIQIEDRRAFIRQQAEAIYASLGNGARPLSDKAVEAIQYWVEAYMERSLSLKTNLWAEGLWTMFQRADQFAPIINKAFKAQNVPQIVGLYLPVVNTEYRNIVAENFAGRAGLFQFTAATAKEYGLDPSERTNVEKTAAAAAKYLRDRMSEFGSDAKGVTLAIASFDRSPDRIKLDLKLLQRGDPSLEKSFWALLENAKKLDRMFQTENLNYVPRFFAAAIIGEAPQVFGLPMQPLSTH